MQNKSDPERKSGLVPAGSIIQDPARTKECIPLPGNGRCVVLERDQRTIFP